VKCVRGGGRLIIEPGSLILELDRMTGTLSGVRRLVHTAPEVTIVHARWLPPWFNTAVLLSDGTLRGHASTWFGARRRLRVALTGAGFDVTDIETRMSLDAKGVRRTGESQLSNPWRAVNALGGALGTLVAFLVLPVGVATLVALVAVAIVVVTLRSR
jgi:hypothetical protein